MQGKAEDRMAGRVCIKCRKQRARSNGRMCGICCYNALAQITREEELRLGLREPVNERDEEYLMGLAEDEHEYEFREWDADEPIDPRADDDGGDPKELKF